MCSIAKRCLKLFEEFLRPRFYYIAGLSQRHSAGGGGPSNPAEDVREGLAHRAIRPQLGEGKDYANDEDFDNPFCLGARAKLWRCGQL